MHHHDPFRARSDAPTALLGVVAGGTLPVPVGDVPEKAGEAVAWMRAVGGDDRKARAVAARAAEEQRDEPRSTVMAEVERALS